MHTRIYATVSSPTGMWGSCVSVCIGTSVCLTPFSVLFTHSLEWVRSRSSSVAAWWCWEPRRSSRHCYEPLWLCISQFRLFFFFLWWWVINVDFFKRCLVSWGGECHKSTRKIMLLENGVLLLHSQDLLWKVHIQTLTFKFEAYCQINFCWWHFAGPGSTSC